LRAKFARWKAEIDSVFFANDNVIVVAIALEKINHINKYLSQAINEYSIDFHRWHSRLTLLYVLVLEIKPALEEGKVLYAA
jgi:hypothetical protein